MNAIGSPEQVSYVPNRRDWLRVAGGMMFGAGALVLLIRKGEWSESARFAGFLIPALILFAVVFAGRARDGLSGWHVAFLVFGTLLLLGALVELVSAIDSDPDPLINITWIFGLCAALAIVSSLALRAQFQMLLGGVLAIIAWLTFWAKVIDEPSIDTLRWLLLVAAAIFLAGGVVLARARKPQASDLITVAGLAAVVAAGFTLAAVAGPAARLGGGSIPGGVPEPGQGWNVFLLVVSLLLIAYESRSPTRGPGYVGAFGLLVFIGITGVDLVSRLKGDEVGGVVGWPLILLLLGAAAVAASFVLNPGGPGPGGPGGGGVAGPGGPGLGAYPQPGATQAGAPALGQPPAPGYGQPAPGGYGQPPAPGQAQPGAAGAQPTAPGGQQVVPGSDQPTAARPIPGQPLPPPGQAPPPQPGQEGQPGTPLDQWRRQPPPQQ